MKTLKIKNDSIELEKREARCNFCGECDKECVKGLLPLKISTRTPLTKGMWAYNNHEVVKTIEGYDLSFWDNKTINGEITYRSVEKDKASCETVITGWEISEKRSDPDICHDCIRQLAKILK